MFLEGKVKFPPVVVTIHWPDRWCSYCLQETDYLPGPMYQCPSCLRVTMGKTQYIEGEVIASH